MTPPPKKPQQNKTPKKNPNETHNYNCSSTLLIINFMNINVTLWKYLLRSIRIMAHKLSKKKKPYKKWVLFKPLMGNNQSMERDEITTIILDKYHNQVRNSCRSCWKKKSHIISVIKCNHFFLNYMAIVEIKAPSTQPRSTDYIYKHNPN